MMVLDSCHRYLPAMIVFWVGICNGTQAQIKMGGLADSTRYSIRNIYADDLGYLYFISVDEEIFKTDQNLNLESRYSNDRLGKISGLDASNPLKVLVYYQEFEIVVLLDNALAETVRFDLNEMELAEIKAAGLSNDNQIWIYDPIDFKLKKLSVNGQVVLESNTLISEKLEHIDPHFLHEKNNQVFLFDRATGLHVFDNFGQYRQSLKTFKDAGKMQILKNGNILFEKGGKLFIFSFRTGLEKPVRSDGMPKIMGEKFVFYQGAIWILGEDEFSILRVD